MQNKKIDITSTVLEKGLDTAKSFLDKLIMPTIEETGLLIKDKVTMWRFNNQVKMLNKAKLICEENNIPTKKISLKLLCPLLDYSGLEEDEVLQDKWAILLSNMVNSDLNIENHVFPYILGQLSSNEFLILEKVYDDKLLRVDKLTSELSEFIESRPKIEKELDEKISEIKINIQQISERTNQIYSLEINNLKDEIRKIETKKNSFKHKESSLNYNIKKSEEIPYNVFKDFELSNVIRLGLIKEEKEFYANSQTLEIPNEREYQQSHTNISLDIEVESNTENILTQLGELFISACKIKKKQNSL